MRTTISSAATIFYKFVFPTIWIGLFGVGTIAQLVKTGFTDETRAPFIGLLFGILIFYASCIRLKKVEIDNDNMYVSNYFSEIEVEKSNILYVEEVRFFNTRPIWIYFREPTAYGKRILFIPSQRPISIFKDSPMVKRLIKFADLE